MYYQPLGFHLTVTRFLKRVFVAKTHSTMMYAHEHGATLRQYITQGMGLIIKGLILKTVMVVFARRGQAIHYLNLDDIIGLETLITFILGKPLKQSKPGAELMPVKFTSYPSDPRMCVITTLRMYRIAQDAVVATIRHCSILKEHAVSKRIMVVCSSGVE